MKHITRDRRLFPEEVAKYKLIRELVEQELPDLIARHHARMEHKSMTDQELLDELGKPSMISLKLLTEAAGTIEASTAEDNISDDRKNYRIDLLKRVKDFLAKSA